MMRFSIYYEIKSIKFVVMNKIFIKDIKYKVFIIIIKVNIFINMNRFM